MTRVVCGVCGRPKIAYEVWIKQRDKETVCVSRCSTVCLERGYVRRGVLIGRLVDVMALIWPSDDPLLAEARADTRQTKGEVK